MVFKQEQRFLEHAVDVEQCTRRLLRPTEVENALDNTFAAMDLVLDEMQRFGKGCCQSTRPHPFLVDEEREGLGARTDRGEWVVDLVHDSGGQRANRGKLLGLRASFLRLTPL